VDIDVFLLDMTSPGISGAEVLIELRQVRLGVQVVITSAYSRETVMSRTGEKQPWPWWRTT
jgi:DNA-binding NarL/FixJ family response regulator